MRLSKIKDLGGVLEGLINIYLYLSLYFNYKSNSLLWIFSNHVYHTPRVRDFFFKLLSCSYIVVYGIVMTIHCNMTV